MKSKRIVVSIVAGAFVSMFAMGCPGPSWPNCKTDDNCKVDEQGQEVSFMCYKEQCVECVEDSQCAQKGEGLICNTESLRCEEKPDCAADADCASMNEDYVCRAGKCVPECAADADCAEGNVCKDQKCVPPSCSQDVDCGPGMKCDAGECIAAQADPWENVSASCRPADMSNAVPGEVSLGFVNFDFNESAIRPDMRGILEQNAECLKQSTQVTIIIEGHCDERGTQEYNLALGEQRAETVRDYLVRMGLDPNRVRTVSKGENEPICNSNTESCWSKNRRVEFIQKTQ